MANHWYLKTERGERGPIPFGELVSLAQAGQIGSGDFVRSTWHKEWQPAGAILSEHIPPADDTQGDAWSEAVHDALTKSRATAHHAERQERHDPASFRWPVSFRWIGGLFHFLFGWTGGLLERGGLLARGRLPAGAGNALAGPIVWLLDRLEAARESALVRHGFRLVCAAIVAGMVVAAIEQWGTHQALRTPSHGPPWDRPFHGRQFPLIGPCTKGEYLFFLVDVAGASAVVAYFAAAWFEKKSDEEG